MTSRFDSQADLDKIAAFNRTETAFPDQATLHALIEAQVDRSPQQRALICDHDKAFGTPSLTYLELNQKANQIAHLLRIEGIKPGQLVAILVERSFAMMIGILGILKAGAAYLPIAPTNPVERIDYMLQDANVAALLIHQKTQKKSAYKGLVIDLEDLETYGGPTENPSIVNTPVDLAYVIYTSGSTGKPKGVMIEHRSVVNRLHWMQHAYPIGEQDVLLQKTPYYFDVSVWELFWWALEGAQLCFLAPGLEGNPLALMKTIKTHRVSVIHFVPSMLSVFLEYLESKGDAVTSDLTPVRRVFASGEALTPSHVKKFNDLWGTKTGAQLTNLYGPTEATVDVTYFDCPKHNEIDRVPIGRPIDNTKLYVLQDGQQRPIGETGELCIAGIGVARGYLNDSVLTSTKFIDNPVNPGERIYRTGDIARWLPDGNVEYLGREDHQVKIRGLRIELGEIENTIRDYPGVTDCVAIVKRYSEIVVLIVAYVVCRPDLGFDELKQHSKEHLPAYMVPNHFERLDRLPLTASGKADRNNLPEPQIQLSR